MSDKELDQLFNSKLTDLEAEPSAELWDKILPEIPGNGIGRSGLTPMLSIAATLVILLTAGLLFMPRTQKLALHGKYDPQQTINEAVAAVTQQPTVAEDVPDVTPEQPVAGQPKTVIPVKPVVTDYAKNTGGATTMVNPVDSVPALTLARAVNIGKPDHQDNSLSRPAIAAVNSGITALKTDQPTNTVKAVAANNPSATKATEVVKKKRIHNLGDLLNVVIAKVDKRDNKIIQFGGGSDDDDDDLLNVTGVNLGPIKVKKQN